MLEDRKILLVLVQHIEADVGGSFLKDVTSPCDTWSHNKQLDLAAVECDQRAFYDHFTEFMGDYARRQQKQCVVALKRLWKDSVGRAPPSTYNTLISQFVSS